MKKETQLVLFGNRVRHLIDILDLKKETYLNCIFMDKGDKYIQTMSLSDAKYFPIRKHRVTKEDIKLISTLYQITGDLETSLFHLFKD